MHGSRRTFLHDAAVFVLSVAVLALLNLVWVIPTIRATYSSASTLALATVERARADVTFSLRAMQNSLEDAAEEIAYDPARKKIVLNRVLKYNPAIKSAGIAGIDGRETFILDRFRFITPADFGDYKSAGSFSSALAGAVTFGDLYISPEQEPHITLFAPMARAGVIGGVLIADINIRDLVSAIHTPEITQSHVYVVDENGYQIIHPNVSEILRRPNFLSRPIVRKVVRDRATADGLAPEDRYVNEDGVAVFTVGMPIAIADFSIFFETPRSVALAGVRQVVVFAGITVLVGALALFLIIRARNRLQRLNVRSVDLLKENYEVGKMLVRRDLELTRANARLEELDEVKSEFVTIAAHQLRTPLTGIRWSYQTLLEEGAEALTSVQRRVLQGGLGASLRMINLVNDLLNVARIEEGRFGFHFTLQSPFKMIQRAAERFRKAARDKGIEFKAELPPAPPRPFFFDEEKMSLALDNMLDNAVKYTEPAGTITFRAAEEGNILRISVSDTGIGVPADQVHRVFAKFFRAGNALRFHTSGTGLGLYVCKNIVEKHDGAMSVESREGKGTKFTITLPRAEKPPG